MSRWVGPGTISAVVLDWAGTTVDHGSRAPVIAMARTFADRGVVLEEADARGPMGIAKREHIRLLLELPAVRDAWRTHAGHEPGSADVDELYAAFSAVLPEAIAGQGAVIPGVARAIDILRDRGIGIGSTTGYVRSAAEAAAALAAEQGYAPDVLVAVDDVPAGRPAPWMLLRAMEALAVYPPAAVVKVGDTIVDMAEGRNAGTWAIGVTDTGNELGLTAAQLATLDPADLAARRAAAEDRLREAGAHFVIPSVAVLPAAIETIETLLVAGERP